MQRRRALEDEPRVHAMIHHGLKLEEYRAFLHDLYDIVWHFCPAMAAAAARCGDEFRNVRYALYERIEEEKEHETWVLEDVGAVGGDVAGAKADPPSAPVQAMIAFNYMASLNQLLKTIADPTAQRSIINSTRMNFYLFAQMFRENGFVTHIAGWRYAALSSSGSTREPADSRLPPSSSLAVTRNMRVVPVVGLPSKSSQRWFSKS